MNTSSIAKRLREERKRLGLTQERFGAKGGVGKLAQLNYEKGERSPDAEYLAALTQIGVDVSYVLTGERVAVAMTPDEVAIVAAFRALDPRGRAGMLALLGGLSGAASEGQGIKAGKRSQVVLGGVNNIQLGSYQKSSTNK
ncbi:helix-turn-helix domain-containing protein [Ralstonia sp. CHL-2022]|uniref:Helix-turn-helix domain-containing protein n=1 Tax=Ralstonia mojiangensis TaxID=2953895 RepID=A0ABT2L3E9_9RALS|nr:helix-turn-helix transcriptional regulator [Ralstonia mojiangensis]MCT7309711.1 helix-turn-helix domain-containing protein [Ralstonia mojiangensis]